MNNYFPHSVPRDRHCVFPRRIIPEDWDESKVKMLFCRSQWKPGQDDGDKRVTQNEKVNTLWVSVHQLSRKGPQLCLRGPPHFTDDQTGSQRS